MDIFLFILMSIPVYLVYMYFPVVHRPLKTWYKGQKFYEDKAKYEARKREYKFDIDKVMGNDTTSYIPGYCTTLYHWVMNIVFAFCMDDRWIPLSLFCAKVNMNYIVRCLRLPVFFVAFVVLMIEVGVLFLLWLCVFIFAYIVHVVAFISGPEE